MQHRGLYIYPSPIIARNDYRREEKTLALGIIVAWLNFIQNKVAFFPATFIALII